VPRRSPVEAVRGLTRLRGLTLRSAKKVFRTEILEGKHSPRGIRFKCEGRDDVQLKNQPASAIPGGWTYVAGLPGRSEWVPAREPPEIEPITVGFLTIADDEGEFDDEAATITAGRVQYRYVTYLLDADAVTEGTPPPTPQQPRPADVSATPKRQKGDATRARAELLCKAARQHLPESLGWTASRALREAQKISADHLLNCSDTRLGEAWREAKQILREEMRRPG
jgi:hypothetical protein